MYETKIILLLYAASLHSHSFFFYLYLLLHGNENKYANPQMCYVYKFGN